MPPHDGGPAILVHLGAGIGNVVLATPLLVALGELDVEVDVVLAADYPETADLLRPWSIVREVFTNLGVVPMGCYEYVLPAIPPFYWASFAKQYRSSHNLVPRPAADLFYQDEQAFYLSFARALGWDGAPTVPVLPIAPTELEPFSGSTLVLAPGCKTGEMAKKRWPYFTKLAERYADVAVVGTADDLHDGCCQAIDFPSRARNLSGQLTLRRTAELIAASGALVGNDSGLAHIAAAVGTPTIMIFGPTPDLVLGAFPANVRVIRRGLPCEPCWFSRERFGYCAGRIDCLAEVTVEAVVSSLEDLGFCDAPSSVGAVKH
jgi:ADP-heptose:LPS heptosyltransferase